MTISPDPQGAHARFLKAELDLGFTFTAIASQRYETGYRESAGKSMMNAERAYDTVVRCLSDPKHATRLTVTEIHDLTAELQRLRDKLVELDRRKDKGRST